MNRETRTWTTGFVMLIFGCMCLFLARFNFDSKHYLKVFINLIIGIPFMHYGISKIRKTID